MTDLNELLKETSRSLYLSARFLPAPVRAAFATAYLLCRYADTIADTSLLPPEQRLEWILLFPALAEHPDPDKIHKLVQAILPSVTNNSEAKLLHNLPACAQAFAKLTPDLQQATREVVRAVCEGMRIDLTVFPNETSGHVKAFKTVAQLENYCHLMGGAPGRFWSQLILYTHYTRLQPESFLFLGHDIGDALQIVNILRDLPRDLRIGRCYIPVEDLAVQGLVAADLLNPETAHKFEPVKRKWIAWARAKLYAAHRYYASLSFTQLRHRAAIAWPVLWAADTLNLLEQQTNLLDPQVRVKISRARVYSTLAATPFFGLSNFAFSKWLNAKLSAGK